MHSRSDNLSFAHLKILLTRKMISESIVKVLHKMLIKDRVKMRSMLALISDWVDRMHAKYS